MAQVPLSSCIAIALVTVLARPTFAQDVELVAQDTRWRLTLENSDPSSGDDVGLLGLHYDLLHPFRARPNLYVGVGTYAGIWGDRGGYFAAGLDAGLRSALKGGWHVEGGMFFGGGGSQIGDDGDGLVFRPHVAVEAPLSDRWSWRLELAYWATSGGDMDGVQLALGVSGFRSFLTGDWSFGELDELDARDLLILPLRLEPTMIVVDPSSGTRQSGTNDPGRRFGMVGVRTHHSLGRNLYVPIEYAAAVSGGGGGFRQLMFGLGEWGPRFTPHIWGVKEVLIGAAGGGGFDTGGGLAARANVGLAFPFDNGWSASIKGGYEWSFGGNFDAWTLQASASWSPGTYAMPRGFDRERLADQGLAESAVELDEWVVNLLHKTASLRASAVDTSGAPLRDTVQLVGVGLERELSNNIDLLLDGATAWSGDAGGYQEAMVGLRYRLTALRPWDVHGQFYLKYMAGVASGPVDVGSGFLQELGVGWRFSPADGMWAGIEANHVTAESGTWEGDVLALRVGWAFARPRAIR